MTMRSQRPFAVDRTAPVLEARESLILWQTLCWNLLWASRFCTCQKWIDQYNTAVPNGLAPKLGPLLFTLEAIIVAQSLGYMGHDFLGTLEAIIMALDPNMLGFWALAGLLLMNLN